MIATILFTGIGAGALITYALFGWFRRREKRSNQIIILEYKTLKPKNKMKKLLPVLLMILTASCLGPGEVQKTAYLVSIDVKEPHDYQWQRFETADSADTYIYNVTGLRISTPGLITDNPPFYDVRNGQFYIYVEKQALYKRKNGKMHWKVYDENMDSLTIKNQ